MAIRILANGKRLDGSLLIPAVDEQAFAQQVAGRLGLNVARLTTLARATKRGGAYRGEVERQRSVDLNDPVAAGWTFLVNDNDPDKAALIDAIRPLAERRGMRDPATPLAYHGEAMEDWHTWLETQYFAIDPATPSPRYVLILGGPDQVPFLFQSLFDSAASVGRLAFDSVDDLRVYVDKVIRLETAADPSVTRSAVFFATDAGYNDPTYYSRRYMADPIADHVADTFGLNINRLMGDQATKVGLAGALTGSTPALVYTASHGLGQPERPLDEQKHLNGAICCQTDGPLSLEDLFGVDDVPGGGAFLEGAAFFQFACYGYGTPAQSDFDHWLGNAAMNAAEDFVAAFPKRLLAHPRGPIVYVGHVDTAWMHGFTNPEAPDIVDPWHERIAPFVQAVDGLLRVNPTAEGLAMMNKRYDLGNAQLSATWDRAQRGNVLSPESLARLANVFIYRSDAQNYMVMGDPAVALRLPAA